MLKNFYKIIDQSLLSGDKPGSFLSGGTIRFTIQLDPSHPVYEGHFPGNPIVPGVCQVQIIKELVSLTLNTELFLERSENIKFLSMIIPVQTPVLDIRLDIKAKGQDQWDVNAVISREQHLFIKFKGLFTKV